jgi:hypothetical protein
MERLTSTHMTRRQFDAWILVCGIRGRESYLDCMCGCHSDIDERDRRETIAEIAVMKERLRRLRKLL